MVGGMLVMVWEVCWLVKYGVIGCRAWLAWVCGLGHIHQCSAALGMVAIVTLYRPLIVHRAPLWVVHYDCQLE